MNSKTPPVKPEVYPAKRNDEMFCMMYYAKDEQKLKAELAEAGIPNYYIIYQDNDFGAFGFDINGSAERYKGVKTAFVYGSYEKIATTLSSTINATPFYYCYIEKEWENTLLYPELAVVLKSELDFPKLELLAQAYSVEIVLKYNFSEIGYGLFFTNQSKGNSLQMANLFYETGLFKTVLPGYLPYFVQLLEDFPDIVINTPTQ